jgi:hypothetical protein
MHSGCINSFLPVSANPLLMLGWHVLPDESETCGGELVSTLFPPVCPEWVVAQRNGLADVTPFPNPFSAASITSTDGLIRVECQHGMIMKDTAQWQM